MHEEHRANQENTRKGKQRETKKKTKQKKNYKKGTNKRREGIAKCESPHPRPIKKSSTKRSKQLITGANQILKSLLIPFFPNTP